MDNKILEYVLSEFTTPRRLRHRRSAAIFLSYLLENKNKRRFSSWTIGAQFSGWRVRNTEKIKFFESKLPEMAPKYGLEPIPIEQLGNLLKVLRGLKLVRSIHEKDQRSSSFELCDKLLNLVSEDEPPRQDESLETRFIVDLLKILEQHIEVNYHILNGEDPLSIKKELYTKLKESGVEEIGAEMVWKVSSERDILAGDVLHWAQNNPETISTLTGKYIKD